MLTQVKPHSQPVKEVFESTEVENDSATDPMRECMFDYIDKDGKRRGRPIDFMGFKFYRDKTTIRKSIFLRACRLARRLNKKMKISWHDACQLLSYLGWFYPTDTFGAYQRHIKPFVSVQKCKRIMSNHDRRKNGNNLQNSSEQRKTA